MVTKNGNNKSINEPQSCTWFLKDSNCFKKILRRIRSRSAPPATKKNVPEAGINFFHFSKGWHCSRHSNYSCQARTLLQGFRIAELGETKIFIEVTTGKEICVKIEEDKLLARARLLLFRWVLEEFRVIVSGIFRL